MKRFLPILFIFFLPLFSFCEEITISEYIGSAADDPRIKTHKELGSAFEQGGDTPVVKALEFRSETGNFDILEQTYALRLYFRGFGETKRSKELMQNSKNILKAQSKLTLSEVVFEKFNSVLTYIKNKKALLLLDSLKDILEDKKEVTGKMSAYSEKITDVDILEIEDKITDIEMKKTELESELDAVLLDVQAAGGNKVPAFEREKIISVGEIKEFIDSLDPENTDSKALDDLHRQKMLIAQSEIALEEAKERDWLKYIALEFDTGDRNDRPSRGFSLGFAISIPGFKSNQNSILKKRLKSIGDDSGFYAEKRLAEAALNSDILMLRRKIRQYEIMVEKREKEAESGILAKYSSLDGVNPLIILKLKERMVKQEIKTAELEAEIYAIYIDLCRLTGAFEEESGKNSLYKTKAE